MKHRLGVFKADNFAAHTGRVACNALAAEVKCEHAGRRVTDDTRANSCGGDVRQVRIIFFVAAVPQKHGAGRQKDIRVCGVTWERRTAARDDHRHLNAVFAECIEHIGNAFHHVRHLGFAIHEVGGVHVAVIAMQAAEWNIFGRIFECCFDEFVKMRRFHAGTVHTHVDIRKPAEHSILLFGFGLKRMQAA